MAGRMCEAVTEFLEAVGGEDEEEAKGTKDRKGASRDLVGLRGGGFKSSPDCRYMIYVINSARYELARQILAELRRGDTVFLIADECHHYGSGENRLIFEFLLHIGEHEERFFSMGLSATLPSGMDRKFLSSVLGRRIYTYGIREASAMGTVCRYDIYHIRLSFDMEEREAYEEVSDAAVGIILSGTSTQRQRTQRLGRILRRKEDGRGASLYYLHIEETWEDSCFLPEGSENLVFELEYCSDARKFFHPLYDEKAQKLLDGLKARGASEEKIKEAARCLELGTCARTG